jgi:hypothetical protein
MPSRVCEAARARHEDAMSRCRSYPCNRLVSGRQDVPGSLCCIYRANVASWNRPSRDHRGTHGA